MKMVMDTPSDRAVADRAGKLRRKLISAGLLPTDADKLLAGEPVELTYPTRKQRGKIMPLMPEVAAHVRGGR